MNQVNYSKLIAERAKKLNQNFAYGKQLTVDQEQDRHTLRTSLVDYIESYSGKKLLDKDFVEDIIDNIEQDIDQGAFDEFLE